MQVTKSSSSYWEGNANAESLQRVYGISFPDPKQLKEWQKFQVIFSKYTFLYLNRPLKWKYSNAHSFRADFIIVNEVEMLKYARRPELVQNHRDKGIHNGLFISNVLTWIVVDMPQYS